MQNELIPKNRVALFRGQIAKIPFIELSAFPEVEQTNRVKWTVELLKKNYNEEGGGVAVISDNDGLLGIAGFRPLTFDTEHFGKKMGRIGPFNLSSRATVADGAALLKTCLRELTSLGCVFIDARIATADLKAARALEKCGFYLGDTQVDYVFRTDKGELPSFRHRVLLRFAKPEDLDELRVMTHETFDNYIDRFHSDPWFDPKRSTEMYVKWLENSMTGLADAILVAQVGKRIGGFLTLQVKKEQNKVTGVRMAEGVLAGVAPWTRGKGVYTSLLAGCLPWFVEHSKIGIVVTQVDNIAVQNAWASLGYRIVQGRYTFHWHK